MADISVFFALLALFWMYPLGKITIVSKLLLPPGIISYNIITAALCTGVIFGILALKEGKNIYPLISNAYTLMIYIVYLQYLGKPRPTYTIILIFIGTFSFVSIALKNMITNYNTNYELYSNISKYLFYLSLIIKAIGSILSYHTQVGDMNILTIIVLITGTILGLKTRKLNNKWYFLNLVFLVVTLIDAFFVLPLDVLFRFL